MAILASFAMVGAGAAVTFVANPAAIGQEVRAEEKTATWTATSGDLGSGVGSGTITDTKNHSWSYTRTLNSGTSYTGFTSNCIQLGKNGGVEHLTLSTSEIPGTIKSVSVECASYQGKHNVAITVGGNSYLDAVATPSWTTVGAKSGTGTSSGEIVISFTGGTRAMYIKSISVTYEEESLGNLQSITVGGSPSAKTLDTEWDLTGVTVVGNYENGTASVKTLCDLEVTEAVPAITSSGSATVHVTATLKTDNTMTDTKALTATLTAIPLGCDQLYTANEGDEITIVGKYLASYVQNASHQAADGVFIGNGDYGAIIYKSDSSLEGVTTDSYIKATGVISEYKGLRELGSTSKKPTFEVISEEEAALYVSAPKDYTMTGTEADKSLVSRQTLVRGTVTAIDSGAFDSTKNTTVTITLANSNTAKVFLKGNQGSVIDYSGLKDAMALNANVTVKGILSVFDADGTLEPSDFQVILPQLVEKDPAITAEVFCESLMEKTDETCAKAESLHHDELVTAWSDLKNDTFARMTDEEIARLKSAAANYDNTSENTLENAMGRYNYLTKKYSLDNFLERDVSGAPVASYLRVAEIANGNQATAITVVSIVVASLITVGAVFAIRRKKKAE